MNFLLIWLGKLFSKLIQTFNIGNGSTWPGHIALSINKNFIREVLSQAKIKTILIAGTNGKTTTASLIKTALEKNGNSVIHNQSGANLLNGIASSLLLNTNLSGKLNQDFAIFEIDENTLPLILEQLTPDYLILLNLFRDQLDRYGEVNSIAKKWGDAGWRLLSKTTLILNADDPQIAYLGLRKNNSSLYFGVNAKTPHKNLQHATDSVYCPNCGNKLTYLSINFSHLGDWKCQECGLQRPKTTLSSFPVYPLPGTYNVYNAHAAALALSEIGINKRNIENAFNDFKPAFGRQEVIKYKGKSIQIFLSKNPTSFNQSYETIMNLKAKTLLLVLNDRIPDGRDVSWIWDVDLPNIDNFKQILISGDRVYDMALRVKYEDYKSFKTYENLTDAITVGVESLNEAETLYILPTYSAMLEVRKILTGKKIL